MNTVRSRWLWVLLCIAFAGVMLLCGWLVPMHLRAVDVSVLQRAGTGGTSLIDRCVELKGENKADAAELILQAAQNEKIWWVGNIPEVLAKHTKDEPLFPGGPLVTSNTPVTTQVIRLATRDSVLAYLDANGSPAVKELLRARDLTNTVLFSPSSSASGQAFDAAVSVCGLLLLGNHLAPGLRDAVVERSAIARTRANAQPLEEILMDVMSLGQRLNWGQLTAFLSEIQDPHTLAVLADQARNAGPQLPVLFAAVVLSHKPDQVAAYVTDYSKTGLGDLSASLRFGEGGLDELLQRHQRMYSSATRQQWASSGAMALFFRAGADYALREPWFALMVKWFFYISCGFLLAVAVHFAWPTMEEFEESTRARGFHQARELLFALGFLLVVLLLSEPFLAQESQKAEFAFRLRLPMAGVAAANIIPSVKTSFMNPNSLLTLLLFFVLQGLIYSACLVKLAEIRRQKVPARVQLKLLENEEHLFDAGLYLGFAGTIGCLILVSLGSIHFSLMAAYSSTCFGVLFVSAFKIFNLRPVRRRLLMQSEAQAAEQAPVTSAEAPLVTTA